MNPVEAGKCRTAGTGAALVAGLCNVIEIVAAGSLQQIAAGRRLVAQLRAGACQERAAQNAVALPHALVACKIAVPHQRADAQATIGGLFDLVERQAVDIDQTRWRLYLQFHQVEQIGTAGDDFCPGLDRSGGRVQCRIGALIGEGLHVGIPAACLMAITMLG